MVYITLADGFEEIEALTVVDILRRAGIGINTVSITSDKKVTGAHGITVVADDIISKADLATSECVILPGGMPGAVNLRNCDKLCQELKRRANSGQLMAAICAAPFILGELGILKGKRATCYPGFENKLEEAVFTGAMVEQDGQIITGKGPAAAMDFALKIVETATSKTLCGEIALGMLYKQPCN